MNTPLRQVGNRSVEQGMAGYFLQPVPLRGAPEQELERTKHRLLDQFLKETPEAEHWKPLLHTANEAAALAWMTPFPLLVLPTLLEEKTQGLRQWVQHQDEICLRSRVFAEKLAGNGGPQARD